MIGLGPPPRWVFLTGMPRSGTTFAGRVLSTPLAVDYLHEPFNPDCGIEGVDQRLVYTRAGAPNEPDVRVAVERLLRYDARFRTGYFDRDSTARRLVKRVVGSRGPFHYRLARANPWHRVALVKDPVGCLLLGYLVAEHGFDAAVVVRHPLGVVHSFERLGWDPFERLAALRAQPWFADDHLTVEDRALLDEDHDDPVVAIAVLWRLLHRALSLQAARHDVPIVRHEDLSADPAEAFARLFDRLRIARTPRVDRRIARETAGGAALADRGGPTQQFGRDSAGIAAAVLGEASPERRRLVWEITGPVATGWYDQASFGLPR